jgi:hypothetical protein
MKINQLIPVKKLGLVAMIASLLGGCGGSDDDETALFNVTLTNITSNQPMSPAAVAVHGSDMSIWTLGEAASVPLETLAEGGDNSSLLSTLEASGAVVASGTGAIAPGASETITIDGTQSTLSLATMLVNTNDGFAGLGGLTISTMAVGESQTLWLPAYDAGTESNSEADGTIPGPADGGEGFNAARDDLEDHVTRHPGVVSSDDGLGTSVLNGSHRFDAPVAKVVVTRTR